MNRPFVPTPFTLEFYFPGEPDRDRRGNLVQGQGSWEAVQVSSWWVDKTEEKGEDSVLRTIDYLHIHVPVGFEPDPGGQVRTPDGEVWQIQGNTENYEHGFHGWSPGLLVVHAKNVKG